MPKAIVDPEELRRFSVCLDDLAGKVRNRKSTLNSKFRNLKSVWQDEKYHQFARLYEETTSNIERFCVNTEQLAQYLREKQKPLRRYQENRY